MARLVEYDSSSSSSDVSESWPSKRFRSSPTIFSRSLDANILVPEKGIMEGEDCLNTNPAAQLEEMGCSPDLIMRGEGYLNTNRAAQLEEMGCSPDLISLAISLCDEGTSVPDLFDFIQAYNCSLKEERNAIENPVAKENICLQKLRDDYPSTAELRDSNGQNRLTSQIGGSNREASSSRNPSVESYNTSTLQKLEEMGFSQAQIQKASDECSSIDFDLLLSYLLVETGTNGKDLKATPVSKHDEKGLPSHVLEKALAAIDSNDIQDLWDAADLFGSIKGKGEAAGHKGNPDKSNVSYAESSHSSLLSSEAEKSYFDKQEESSRIKSAPRGVFRQEPSFVIHWTKAMEKLWTSYMGGPKKFECSPLPDSENSAEIFQPSYKDANQNSRSCKRKSNVIDHKNIEKVKPQLGKMMGFGIPGLPIGRPKQLPRTMIGPPYFYFENVAGVPSKEWETIKRHFNDVEPEFTDSRFFCACRRPRGYVHNLPVEGRTAVHYVPQMTIFEAFPHMQKYWPRWDTREQLNCINTQRAPDKMCGLIRTLFAIFEGKELPYQRQQEIVLVSKRWNLVWVGPGKAAPLEPHEIEFLLGFDQDHTRGCASMTERYDALGNSFQVDTVAYHLSPLKALYPNGIVVLSLFSGIGGAEVALHKVGIYLKVVISVEFNEKVRGILEGWWRKTGQKGELRLRSDVKEMTYEVLADLVDEVGPIDLIIGGSPCNNLSGNNRVSRSGLSGTESSLFFEFPRILNIVKQVMQDKGFI